MKETELVRYFCKKVDPEDLHHIISSSVIKKETEIKIFIHDDLKEEYFVKSKDIINICDDYLKGIFDDNDLYVIGFTIFGSDDIEIEESIEGDRILDVVGDWANYKINGPISRESVKEWKQFILDGKKSTKP